MRLEKLASFIKTLEDEGIYRFNIKEFENRLKLQKLVYIAKFFEIDLGYSFSDYLRGPYSPELADDYFKLSEKWYAYRKSVNKIDSLNFRKFIEFVRNKSTEELEGIATGLMFLRLFKMLSIDLKDLRHRLAELIRSRKPFLADKADEIARIIELVFA